MKILILMVLLTGCAIPGKPSPRRPVQPYKEKIAERIENCMVRLADRGIEENLLYSLCSKTHRPNVKAKELTREKSE